MGMAVCTDAAFAPAALPGRDARPFSPGALRALSDEPLRPMPEPFASRRKSGTAGCAAGLSPGTTGSGAVTAGATAASAPSVLTEPAGTASSSSMGGCFLRLRSRILVFALESTVVFCSGSSSAGFASATTVAWLRLNTVVRRSAMGAMPASAWSANGSCAMSSVSSYASYAPAWPAMRCWRAAS